MKIKPGANIEHSTPAMVHAREVTERAFNDEDYILVVTSGNDGKHKEDSLHYENNAEDYRTRHIRGEIIPRIVARIKKELGTNYDVLFEGDHLHIEHDPKGTK